MKYFTKKWYLNGCIDKPIIEDEHYYEYDTDIHDLKINNTVRKNGDFTIIFDDNDIWSNYSKIVFYDSEIIENVNLIGAYCLADEIYINNDYIEYHLLIWSENIDDFNNLGYFTIKSRKVLFYSSNTQNNAPILSGSFFEIRKGSEGES